VQLCGAEADVVPTSTSFASVDVVELAEQVAEALASAAAGAAPGAERMYPVVLATVTSPAAIDVAAASAGALHGALTPHAKASSPAAAAGAGAGVGARVGEVGDPAVGLEGFFEALQPGGGSGADEDALEAAPSKGGKKGAQAARRRLAQLWHELVSQAARDVLFGEGGDLMEMLLDLLSRITT